MIYQKILAKLPGDITMDVSNNITTDVSNNNPPKKKLTLAERYAKKR